MSQGLMKKGLLSGALIAAAVSAVPDTASAGLVYDLRFADGTSTKDAAVGTYTVELWARLSGTDGNTTNEGIQTNYIVLQSTELSGGAVVGNISSPTSVAGVNSGTRRVPFNGTGTRSGTTANLTADDMADWGSNSALATDTGYMFARSNAATMGGAVPSRQNIIDSNTVEIQVGVFNINVTGLEGSGETRIAIVQPAFPTGGGQDAYAVYWDDAALDEETFQPLNGTQTNVTTTANNSGVYGDFVTFTAGAPIPEPTSLALVGLAGAGLLARRRRD